MDFIQPWHLILLLVVFVPFIAIVIAVVRLLKLLIAEDRAVLRYFKFDRQADYFFRNWLPDRNSGRVGASAMAPTRR